MKIPRSDDPAATTASSKIADVEFLRGLAIALTLVAHSILAFPNSAEYMAFLSNHWFGSGVDLFFVISGFVITTSLRGQMMLIWREISTTKQVRRNFGFSRRERRALAGTVLVAFWVRRAFRLLPGAFVTVAVTMLFIAVFTPKTVGGVLGGVWVHTQAGIAAVLQIFNFWEWRQTVNGGEITLLGAYWSLSLEEQFYFLFPFILVAVGSLRRAGLIALMIVIGMFFVRKSLPNDTMWWFRIDGLFWGVAIACFRPDLMIFPRLGRRTKMVIAAIALVVCTAGMTETIILMYAYDCANGVTLLFAACLVIVASWNRDLFQFPLIGPFMVYVGERSYAIYLLHFLILAAAQIVGSAALQAGVPPAWTAAITALFIILSIIPINIFHKYIEIHFRDAGRRLSARILAHNTLSKPPIEGAVTIATGPG